MFYTNLIFDMGGVLMEHNIPACIERFKEILGENYHRLGLREDGEGKFIMDKFGKDLVDEDYRLFLLSNSNTMLKRHTQFAAAASAQPASFNGLDNSPGSLYRISDAQTRFIHPHRKR